MREKNLDLMRQDIVSVLKNSSMAFVRELVGADPVAVFRWAIIRAFFRGYFAFRTAGVKHRKERADQSLTKLPGKNRFKQHNDLILRYVNFLQFLRQHLVVLFLLIRSDKSYNSLVPIHTHINHIAQSSSIE